MNSKTLSSWMLIVAPVLFFLVFFIGWEALVGSSENTAEELANILEKRTIVGIFSVVGTIVLASLTTGFALLAWSKADGSTAEGTLASIAAMIFVGMTAIVFLFFGMGFPVIGEGAENLVEAEWIWVVSDSMFAALFLAWTAGNIVLGVALLIENKINQIASGLLLLTGIVMALLHLLVGIDDMPEFIWIIPFVLAIISAVVLGIFNLRSES
ncbi:MAG: hypothetical protein CL698_09030 [Chloroflexi bacterium]|nr:hypothetical protein [Chloroflexota bacterium]MBE42995.1 hypothetical protein [Chloroflexota bacterium]MQG01621.1 hypothetical protein [SAR202 cluster bacterium]